MIKLVMHHPDDLNACPNKPAVLHILSRVTRQRAVDHLDAHACPNCLSGVTTGADMRADVVVTKKRHGAPWHRPDAAGICRDCGWTVPEDQR